LSVRDRTIVTLTALITRNQTIELPSYVNLALDNGVTPGEISEIITHLAFYSGWVNATTAIAVVKDIFASVDRGGSVPAAAPQLLPLDQAVEDRRAASRAAGRRARSLRGSSSSRVMSCFATCGCARTLRLGIGACDRQRADHLRPGSPDHVPPQPSDGQRPDEGTGSGVLAHLAFYAGWPNAFSAVPVVKGVFESRPS